MTDRLDAIREKRQRAYPANTLSHDEADWLIEQVASLRARVETAEQEIAAAVAVFHGDPPIPNEMTLVEKVQNVLAQLSEARTKQAEAESDLQALAEHHRATEQSCRSRIEERDNALAKLTEERTRREQAERERDEAQLLARHGAQECVSATELLSAAIAERDTLQLDLAALRQQIADGR